MLRTEMRLHFNIMMSNEIWLREEYENLLKGEFAERRKTLKFLLIVRLEPATSRARGSSETIPPLWSVKNLTVFSFFSWSNVLNCVGVGERIKTPQKTAVKSENPSLTTIVKLLSEAFQLILHHMKKRIYEIMKNTKISIPLQSKMSVR